ncbi:hypothetical protein VPH35_103225 [Triticum aestivum]
MASALSPPLPSLTERVEKRREETRGTERSGGGPDQSATVRPWGPELRAAVLLVKGGPCFLRLLPSFLVLGHAEKQGGGSALRKEGRSRRCRRAQGIDGDGCSSQGKTINILKVIGFWAGSDTRSDAHRPDLCRH